MPKYNLMQYSVAALIAFSATMNFAKPAVAAEVKRLKVFLSEDNLTEASVKYLAEIARPVTVDLKKGNTLKDVVMKACGRDDELYFKYIIKDQSIKLPQLNAALGVGAVLDKKTKITTAASVELPFCLKLPEDNVYLRRRTGIEIAGWTDSMLSWNSYKWNPSMTATPGVRVAHLDKNKFGPTAMGWSRAANPYMQQSVPGTIILNPKPGIRTAIGLPAPFSIVKPVQWGTGSPMTAEIIRRANAIRPKHVGHADIPLKAGTQAAKNPDDAAKDILKKTKKVDGITRKSGLPDDEGLQLFSAISDDELSGDTNCIALPKPPWEYPFNRRSLFHVLGGNRLMPDFSKTHSKDGATILIIDSGLHGLGGDPFFNGPINDLYEEADAEPAVWLPVKGSDDEMHGTMVASTAIGTSSLREMMALVDFPIKIHVRTIVKDDKGVHKLNGTLMDNALDSADVLAPIVNLSFKRAVRIKYLEERIAKRAQLFVVAAGNGKMDSTGRRIGFKLGSEKIYPPLYGGGANKVGNVNLITVGALKVDGTYATFSNFGPDFVEIAAPGCSVPVHTFDRQTMTLAKATANGTSFAAPLVAFAAGLIKWQVKLWKPEDIKKRLLVSADIPNDDVVAEAGSKNAAIKLLPKKIMHGRILNVAKAVAVYHDVLTARHGGSMVLGRIKNGFDQVTFCGGALKGEKFRKIVPRYTNTLGRKGTLVYYEDANQQLKSALCPPSKADDNQSITLVRADTGKSEDFDMSEFRDLVFRDR